MSPRSTSQTMLGALVGLLVAAVLVLVAQLDDESDVSEAVAPSPTSAQTTEPVDGITAKECDRAVVVSARQVDGDDSDWQLEVRPRSCAPHAQLRRTTLLALCDAVAALVTHEPSATTDGALATACHQLEPEATPSSEATP